MTDNERKVAEERRRVSREVCARPVRYSYASCAGS